MTQEIINQILAIRKSGKVNMFDIAGVRKAAIRRGYSDLVIYLMQHKNEYCMYIMTGQVL